MMSNELLREKTMNEFTAVKDIKDNFLYTKDNCIFEYLKVENFDSDIKGYYLGKAKNNNIVRFNKWRGNYE